LSTEAAVGSAKDACRDRSIAWRLFELRRDRHRIDAGIGRQRRGLAELRSLRSWSLNGLPVAILGANDGHHANGCQQQTRSPNCLTRHRRSPSTHPEKV
jgi:hypothetical protein